MRLLFTLAGCMTALSLWSSPALAQSGDALWSVIQTRPHIVVVLRHGEVGPGDSTHFDASGRCQGERMLTPQGQQQARAVGQLFASKGLTPERVQVVASAMCRTRDTAQLAFGQTQTDPALREFLSGGGERMNEATDAAEGWIKRLRGDRPVILVTHLPNIDALTGEQPSYGEAVVAESAPDGALNVLGILPLR